MFLKKFKKKKKKKKKYYFIFLTRIIENFNQLKINNLYLIP